MMFVIAEVDGRIEIFPKSTSVGYEPAHFKIRQEEGAGVDGGFDKLTILPVESDIDLEPSDVVEMLKQYRDEEYERLRDERVEASLQRQDEEGEE